jgi:hypothetical protein
VSQESANRSFDELARALAEGSISRRRALKLFAGAAIASLIPSTRAMAASTCPPGTVKICHVPRREGRCRRGAAKTLCVSPEEAARHASHPCDCCGGCGGTDNCREPRPRTCFSQCIPDGGACSTGGTPCCSGNCVNGTCSEACPGDLLTPVGGGPPLCACAQQCFVSCADCPGGTICVTDGFCSSTGPPGFNVTCATPCA